RCRALRLGIGEDLDIVAFPDGSLQRGRRAVHQHGTDFSMRNAERFDGVFQVRRARTFVAESHPPPFRGQEGRKRSSETEPGQGHWWNVACSRSPMVHQPRWAEMCARILQQCEQLQGGGDKLAAFLGVKRAELDDWLAARS